MNAVARGNILFVQIFEPSAKEYLLTLGQTQSVKLPVNSRSIAWNIVDALHQHHAGVSIDSLPIILDEINRIEKDGKFSPTARNQLLLFITTTGMLVTTDRWLAAAYLAHSGFSIQCELFKRLLIQMGPTTHRVWSSFVADIVDSNFITPVMPLLVHEINAEETISFTSRVLMNAHKMTLEIGIKSQIGDILGRMNVLSIEVI